PASKNINNVNFFSICRMNNTPS
ncbi:unnamed protein product, partial [Allacma fusca]